MVYFLRFPKHRLIRSIVLCLAFAASPAYGQKPATTEKSSQPSIQKTKTSGEKSVDPVVEQRRQTAIYLLTSLADEARSYRDEVLRVRVQARTADALWDGDQEQARALFRRAWEATVAVMGPPFAIEGRNTIGRVSPNAPPRSRTNLRSEILRLAARRDPALGEEFLKKLVSSEIKTDDEGSTSQNSSISDAEVRERLRIASEFLEAGNLERALQFAEPALTQVTNRSIGFLIELRDKNAAAADQRFASLLSRAANDPTADANTVSLLTTYAFTPSMVVVVSETGIPSGINSLPRPAPDLAPALRAAFFRTASAILLRPANQLDQSSAGRAGTYYMARRIFPLFQQYAPQLAPAIAAQITALAPDAVRAGVSASDYELNRGIGARDSGRDELQDGLQDRLDRAQTSDQRDRAYAFAAMRATDLGDPRAREFAEKIEDLETRSGLLRFVDYSFIETLLRKKEVEEAVRLLRKTDLGHTQRARVFTSAARVLTKTNRARALELLDEALGETRGIEASSSDRAYALVAILAQLSAIDRGHAWELTSDTVKAINAVADFTGENGRTSLMLEGKFSIEMHTELASPSDLPEAFATLAGDDMFRVMSFAKGLEGEAPRSLVTIAIAHAVLAKKID
jgi:hypothetical protein